MSKLSAMTIRTFMFNFTGFNKCLNLASPMLQKFEGIVGIFKITNKYMYI